MATLAANPLHSTEFLLTVGLLAVVLLAGAVVLYATDLWRKKQAVAPDDSPLTLNHYHELYAAGELTEAEYVKVRDRLTGKMVGRPPPPPVESPPPADVPPPAG